MKYILLASLLLIATAAEAHEPSFKTEEKRTTFGATEGWVFWYHNDSKHDPKLDVGFFVPKDKNAKDEKSALVIAEGQAAGLDKKPDTIITTVKGK